MMRLRWVRTILVAVGFAWLMVQWHISTRMAHADEIRFAELVAANCSGQDRPDNCELGLRLRARTIEVRGNVEMGGYVDVQ